MMGMMVVAGTEALTFLSPLQRAKLTLVLPTCCLVAATKIGRMLLIFELRVGADAGRYTRACPLIKCSAEGVTLVQPTMH